MTSLDVALPGHGQKIGISLKQIPSALPYLLFAAVILPIFLLGVAMTRDWQHANTEMRSKIKGALELLELHTKHVFKTQGMIAARIEDRIAGVGQEEISGSRELHRFLHDLQLEHQFIHSIWITDQNGVTIASSRSFPADPVNVSDRSYVHELRDDPYKMVAISEPFREARLATKDKVFAVSFRREHNGAFAGTISFGVSPSYFQDFYRLLDSRENSIALISQGGTVLAHLPELPAASANAISPLLDAIRERNDDIVEAASPVDDIDRTYGFSKVGALPLFISYGVSSDDTMEQWLADVQIYALLFLPAFGILALLALFGWRNHKALLHLNSSLETIVDARTHALEDALCEKEILLKEVHHRVKNNMQVITSIVRLQSLSGGPPEETDRRIRAMALVHEMIYASGDFNSMDLASYSQKLCDTLRTSNVNLHLDLDPVRVDLNSAVPYALILGEVATTAIHHAYPDGRRGAVTISLRRTGPDGAILEVSDDGSAVIPAAQGSFGMKLIRSLAVQLQAEWELTSETGTSFRMTFPALPERH